MSPCTAEVGPAVPVSASPVELFGLFFTDDLLATIVRETNRYARQCLPDDKHWATNSNEIRAYLGFCILMGINKLPELRDYWVRDIKLNYAPISTRISRKRFEEITRYLHFVNNKDLLARGEDGYSRLQKIDPVISAIKARCLAVYRPHTQYSIDEAMIPYKGK